jgi:high-affinity K+ transport system ATPase subunit B
VIVLKYKPDKSAMKKIAMMIMLFALVFFASFANQQQAHPVKQKTDTVRHKKTHRKHRIVDKRTQQRQLQLRQIELHKKELKKVHEARKELNRELNRPDTN